jgi:hypothetical protein
MNRWKTISAFARHSGTAIPSAFPALLGKAKWPKRFGPFISGLEKTLKANGLSFADVIKQNVYATDQNGCWNFKPSPTR